MLLYGLKHIFGFVGKKMYMQGKEAAIDYMTSTIYLL